MGVFIDGFPLETKSVPLGYVVGGDAYDKMKRFVRVGQNGARVASGVSDATIFATPLDALREIVSLQAIGTGKPEFQYSGEMPSTPKSFQAYPVTAILTQIPLSGLDLAEMAARQKLKEENLALVGDRDAQRFAMCFLFNQLGDCPVTRLLSAYTMETQGAYAYEAYYIVKPDAKGDQKYLRSHNMDGSANYTSHLSEAVHYTSLGSLIQNVTNIACKVNPPSQLAIALARQAYGDNVELNKLKLLAGQQVARAMSDQGRAALARVHGAQALIVA